MHFCCWYICFFQKGRSSGLSSRKKTTEAVEALKPKEPRVFEFVSSRRMTHHDVRRQAKRRSHKKAGDESS